MSNNYLLLKSIANRRLNDSLTMVATVKGFLSRDECKQIIIHSSHVPYRDGYVDDKRNKSSTRESEVKFIMPTIDNMWLFEKLDAAITHMNKAYLYDLLGFFEGFQIAKYTYGGKFDWHMDLGTADTSTRKLSMSIQLSDPEDYDGGDLEFANVVYKQEKALGSLIVFPSFLQHRVTTVTQGTRLSLVSWVHGQPFR